MRYPNSFEVCWSGRKIPNLPIIEMSAIVKPHNSCPRHILLSMALEVLDIVPEFHGDLIEPKKVPSDKDIFFTILFDCESNLESFMENLGKVLG